MVFKKLPYWFKFGIIFSIIFFIVDYILTLSINRLFSGESLFGYVIALLSILPLILLPSNFIVLPISGLIIIMISTFLMYFILGIFIGLIIQKAKNKIETTKVNKTGIKLVIFLIVLYILFVISVYYLQVPKNEEDCMKLPLDLDNEYNKDIRRNLCLSNLADKNLDPNICQKITYIMDKNYCFESIAIKTNNLDVCEKIENDYSRDNCLELFGVKPDLGMCERKQDIMDKDFCLSNLATDTKNPDICEKITTNYSKRICLKHFGITRDDLENATIYPYSY